MTGITAPARSSHVAAATHRLTFPRMLRGEWIKLATLRSTWWSVAIVAVLTVGMALLIAALAAQGTSTIANVDQIDRGYQEIDRKLRGLGAHIERIKA